MYQTLLNKLCCPQCKERLILCDFMQGGIRSERSRHETKYSAVASVDKTVKSGVLLCQNCRTWYPIYSYVPVMLIFETRFHKKFANDFTTELEKLSEYAPPRGLPESGEVSVQDTFTDEWDCVQDHELSFLYSVEELKSLNEKVWLKWLKDSSQTIKSILNVGCGLGRESLALQEVITDSDVFAVDLNFAVLRSGEVFKSNPNIHFVIASLFHLPFKSASFDLVYSQGVIHHTFSTAAAFKSIASYVCKGGFIFIWVYGRDDHLFRKGFVGFLTRTNYSLEQLVRPVISACPKVIRDMFFVAAALLLHPLIKSRVRHKATWNVKNTEHDLRDWLSPKYAHRHSYNELFEWFEDLGFKVMDVQSTAAYKLLFQKSLWGVGLTGNRI